MAEAEGYDRTILIAIDRSSQSEQAFDWYMANIHRPENQVVLVHVPEGPTIEMSKGVRLSEGEFRKLTEAEKKETEEITTKYQAKTTAIGLKAVYKTVFGKPGEALIDASKDLNATVIIMGTRGMGTIRRTIMGSVSDYVVHHSDIPVIVCRN